MPWKSPEHVDIPDVHVATYLFKSPDAELPTDPLFISVENPISDYLTLSSYRLWSQRFAAGLRKRGFEHGDRLLVYSTNSIYYPVCIMGAMMAGGIFTGSSAGYTIRELAYHMKDSDPKFVLLFPEGLESGLAAAKEAGIPQDRIFVFDGEAAPAKTYSHRHWTDLLVPEAEGRSFVWDMRSSPDVAQVTAGLNYSSGTTGLPKGVEVSHKNYVANLVQIKHGFDQRPDPVGDSTIQLCFLPMNHAMAQLMMVMGTPAWGGRIYVQRSFNFMQVLKDIERFKVNFLFVVPPVLVAMSKTPLLREGKIDLSSIRSVGCGAAPVSTETLQSFQKLFKPEVEPRVRNGYGMSEATCGISIGPTDADPTEDRSVGQLLANCEGKIVAEDGSTEITARGTPKDGPRGELWVRGPNVMKGYWRKPDATASTMTEDGWLKTGDVCCVDDSGRIYIVDRMKELIKVKGNQVAPAELEALLLEHDAINDAAVIGVPTADGDEVPRAYVQLKPGSKVGEKAIQDFVAAKVNKNKKLAGGVRFQPDGIPKNPSGKILRKVLRELAAKERREGGARL